MSIKWIDVQETDKLPVSEDEYHYTIDKHNIQAICRYISEFPSQWISLDGRQINDVLSFSEKPVKVNFYTDKGEYEAIRDDEEEGILTAKEALILSAKHLLKEELEIIKKACKTSTQTDYLDLTSEQIAILHSLGYATETADGLTCVVWLSAGVE